MTLIEALKRQKWRLENGQYKPNEQDAEAFKIVVAWINRQKEQELKKNHFRLFAKIFTYAFTHEVAFYGCTDMAQRKIREVLSQPDDILIENLRDVLNTENRINFYKSIGFDFSRKDIHESQELEKRFKDALSDENIKEYYNVLNNEIVSQTVENDLKNTITEFINTYKNRL